MNYMNCMADRQVLQILLNTTQSVEELNSTKLLKSPGSTEIKNWFYSHNGMHDMKCMALGRIIQTLLNTTCSVMKNSRKTSRKSGISKSKIVIMDFKSSYKQTGYTGVT